MRNQAKLLNRLPECVKEFAVFLNEELTIDDALGTLCVASLQVVHALRGGGISKVDR